MQDDKARSELLNAGYELWTQEHVSPTLKEALLRAGIKRALAYRIFGRGDAGPEGEFHDLLAATIMARQLAHLVTNTTKQVGDESLYSIAAALSDSIDTGRPMLASDASDELTQFLAITIRDATRSITDGSATNPQIRAYLSTYTAAREHADSARVGPALAEVELAAIEALAPFVREAIAEFGLQPKGQWTYHNMATAAVAAITKTLKRQRDEETDQNGLTELGRTCLALIAVATEPISSRSLSAPPAHWLIPPAGT